LKLGDLFVAKAFSWRHGWKRLCAPFLNSRRKTPSKLSRLLVLEELEERLSPASFAVNAQLQITQLSEPGPLLATGGAGTSPAPHAVLFFESAVADYPVLRQGLSAQTDAVLLDSSGDGLREMAAFLADRHNLTSIGVVAHGAPGAVSLGTTTLDLQNLSRYTRELAAVGSALGRAGELDL
jgi:hypothetical protein